MPTMVRRQLKVLANNSSICLTYNCWLSNCCSTQLSNQSWNTVCTQINNLHTRTQSAATDGLYNAGQTFTDVECKRLLQFKQSTTVTNTGRCRQLSFNDSDRSQFYTLLTDTSHMTCQQPHNKRYHGHHHNYVITHPGCWTPCLEHSAGGHNDISVTVSVLPTSQNQALQKVRSRYHHLKLQLLIDYH